MKWKRQIYAAILYSGLLAIRRRSTESSYCHITADFLHNVPHHMLEENFNDLDFFFLNIEVVSYLNCCRHESIFPEHALLALTEELRGIVPEELKSKLAPSKYGGKSARKEE